MPRKDTFWKNKRVLITGFSGFLGSWLTKHILLSGAKVAGLDVKPYRPMTVLGRDEIRRVKVVRGSVENYQLVRRAVTSHRAEYIFHLAAQSLVGKSLDLPLKAFSTNIGGTWNVLEASRNCKFVKGIIIASSDKAYGSKNKLPYREDDSLEGRFPYDVSKSCEDLLARAYFYTFGLPVCVTRCGNIFGPGDFNYSRIIPDTIRSTIQNKTLGIRSNGKFTRDYIYIKDIVSGYILIAEKLQKLKLSGEAFNFSNETPTSVLDLVNNIFKLTGKEANYKILNQAQFEIKDQYLSAQKARKMLDWKPRYTLNEGLIETIAWYNKIFT